jgi:hypothetical protein
MDSSIGKKCLTPMGSMQWGCGCESEKDCIAAAPNSNVAGQTCDTAAKSCTTLCGAMGLTACNGGCCEKPGGQCRPGLRDTACGLTGGFCVSCTSTCQPGPRCDPTGACGCFRVFSTASDLTCNGVFQCFGGGLNRVGCDLVNNSCCIPGVYKLQDKGNPANCCTGTSTNGVCDCKMHGESAGTPKNEWFCCSLLTDAMGNCLCRNNGVNVNFGAGVEARACCSLKVSGDLCAAANKNEPCQSNAGCVGGTTCQMGKCM